MSISLKWSHTHWYEPTKPFTLDLVHPGPDLTFDGHGILSATLLHPWDVVYVVGVEGAEGAVTMGSWCLCLECRAHFLLALMVMSQHYF